MQIATVFIIPIKLVMIIPIYIYIYIYNANSKAYNTNQHSNKHHIITPINIIMPMKIRHRPLRHEVWRRSSPGGGLNMWRFRHGDPPLFNGRSPGS